MAVAGLECAAAGACSSIETTAEWKDPEYKGGAVKSFLVVGVSDNRPARRRFEDEFAAKLQVAGAAANASYKALGEDVEPSAETVEVYLDGSSEEAILVTHLLGSEERSICTTGEAVLVTLASAESITH